MRMPQIPPDASSAGYAAAYLFLLGAAIAKPFTELPGLLRQQLHDPIDELFRGIDRRTGAVERYAGIGPKSVIGDRLEIVGLGQELTQLKIEPGLVLVSRANCPCTPLWVLASLPVRSAINACAA